MLRALQAGHVSSQELLELHLERIELLNPVVNAVITVDAERARAEARAADARRASGLPRGALDGLPMTVKDSLCVAGMRTTAGAPFLANHIATEDAAVVAKLKQGGAIIFGKTNLPVMAGDLQTANPLFGITRNPWNTDRTSGGSSGGAAAALATGLTPLEIGSDIAGSLRNPAHYCGIYAHKPTYQAILSEGHIPPPPGIAAEADMGTVGPMTRTAGDLEILFDVLVGPAAGQRAGWTPMIPAPRRARLREYRIAVWADEPAFGVDAATRAMMEDVAQALAGSGAQVDTARPFVNVTEVVDAYLRLVMPLFAAGLSDPEIATLAPLAERSSEAAAKYLRYAVRSRSQSMADYVQAKEIQARTRRSWAAFFADHDALICPVVPTAAFHHVLEGVSFQRTVSFDGNAHAYWDQALWCGALANFAYLPATARPVKLSQDNLPMGIQIVGPFMEDRTTLHIARLLDDCFGGFAAPTLARPYG